MSQSFYTAISGISSAQAMLEVVSNNLANMNTTAYKSSSVNFETVYSNTISAGSGSTDTTGGTNPIQVGLGASLASISTNYTQGTVESTGDDSDLNIQGKGYFCLQGNDGLLLSRAGDFSLDSNDNLVSSGGYKVYGTDSVSGAPSDSATDATIKIPSCIKLTEEAKDLTASGADKIEDLNNVDPINVGTFTLTVTSGSTPYEIEVDATGCTTLSEIAEKINTAIADYQSGSPASYIFSTGTTQADRLASCSVTSGVNANGTFSVSYDSSGEGTPSGITFTDETSNFCTETGLSSASASSGTYSSNVLSHTITIAEGDKSVDPTKTGWSVSNTGAITISYSNGDSISTTTKDGNVVFTYTTADGDTINSEDIHVPSDILQAANLQLRLATVSNEGGLVSEGSNSYSVGANAGTITYALGNSSTIGKIASGGLEASNVDMSTEFANMILAQRAIDANSRTFSIMNQVMSTLVSLGRG